MSFSLPTGRRRRLLVVVAPTVAAALLLAACSSSKKAATAPSSSAAAAATTSAAAPPPPRAASAAPASAATGSGAAPAPQATTCADYAQYTSDATKGKTVTMFGSILPPESDSLNKSWAQFESAPASRSPTKARTTSSRSCRCEFRVAPHLTWRSSRSPGLLAQMVALGAVKAPPAGVVANEDKYWNAAWKSYGSVNGTFYAAPQSANMKSLVWYSPSRVRQGRLHDPDDVGPARSTVRQDRGHRHQAVVRRHRIRYGDRLAGHRLARRDRAQRIRRPGLRRLGEPQGQLRRPEDRDQRCRTSPTGCRTRSGSTADTAT